jgi:hypothetical protein
MNGQSYNRYSYVMNNPTNFTDPTGFSRIEQMQEDKLQRQADQFARSDDATKAAATEKHGAGMVNAILGVAKGGITAETMGAVMNAAGQMKESAKNKAAAVAGPAGSAVVGFVADQVGARFEDAGTVLNAAGTAATYVALKVTGNEAAADLASDSLRESRGDVVEAGLATATGGGSRNAKQLVKAADREVDKVITVSRKRHPESAKHIAEAQAAGKPSILTVDRTGADARRAAALSKVPTKKGTDRDEYPPAMFSEGGKGSSVRHINSSDNRGSGSCIGAQCRNLPDGSTVKLEVTK